MMMMMMTTTTTMMMMAVNKCPQRSPFVVSLFFWRNWSNPCRSSPNYYAPLSPLTPTAEMEIVRYRGSQPIPELWQNIHDGISQPAIAGKHGWHRPLPRRTPPIRQSPKWFIHCTSRTNFAEYNGLPRPLPRSCYPSASPDARLRLLTSIGHKLCDCLPLARKELSEDPPPLKASP